MAQQGLRILVSILVLLGFGCAFESDPRARPEFSSRIFEFGDAFSKKSLEIKLRDVGTQCVTIFEGCSCSIKQTNTDNSVVIYENKFCAIGAAQDEKKYFRIGLNCFTPSDRAAAVACDPTNGKLVSKQCKDATDANPQSLLFRYGSLTEPDSMDQSFESDPEFQNPVDPKIPKAAVADSIRVVEDLALCGFTAPTE